MNWNQRIITALATSLTLPLSAFAFDTNPPLSNFRDSYPNRQLLLQKSADLCRDLFASSQITNTEVSNFLQKNGFQVPMTLKIKKDSGGWTIDNQFVGSSAQFLRLLKIGSSFIVSYRQNETDIEGILNATFENNCQQIQDVRFTFFNSSQRPVKRVKVDHFLQVTQVITMEEPLKEVSSPQANAQTVRIGVIDSGVDYNHPALIGKTRPMLGVDLTNPSRPPYDYTNTIQNELMGRHFSHGSAVADIASRNVNALIVPVRTENQSNLNGEAVEYLAKQKVRVVNVSQGTAKKEDWLSFKAAVERHPEILFIVSAGNNSQDIDVEPVYPSGFEISNMLVVASVDSKNQLSSFSNFGARHVHVAAVGENISAALAGGGEWKVNGTSFAAPLVTRLAAKIFSERPQLKAAEVRELLIQKAKPVVELQNKIQFGVLKDN